MVHRERNDKRVLNATVTEMDEILFILPTGATGDNGWDVNCPVNGHDIRNGTNSTISAVLRMYRLNVDDLLLCEKKLSYMRFIGVSRELMDKVMAVEISEAA
jgi:hypothetical protein